MSTNRQFNKPIRITGGGLAATFNSNTVGALITTGGNVGIGTMSPQSALQVAGAINNAPTSNGIHMGLDAGTLAQIQMNSTVGSYIDFSTSGTDYLGRLLYTNSNNSLVYQNNFNTFIFAASTGNIGMGTSSPQYTLDVNGSARINSTAGLLLGTSTDVNGNRMISALNSSMNTGGANYITVGRSNDTNNQAELGFYYNGNGNGTNSLILGCYGAERMRVQANGNVGIATLSPQYTLDVNGSFRGSTTNTGNFSPPHTLVNLSSVNNPAVLSMFSPNMTTGSFATSFLGQSLSNGNAAQLGFGYYGNNNTANSISLTFYGNAGNNMFLLNNGNVGINTSNPQTKLHVQGNSQVFIGDINSGFSASVPAAAGGTTTWSGARLFFDNSYNGTPGTGVPANKICLYNNGFTAGLGIEAGAVTYHSGQSHTFYGNANTTNTYGNAMMMIGGSGAIGMGTTQPSTGFATTIPNAKLSLLSGTAGSFGNASRLSIGADNSHYAAIEGTHIGSGSTTLAFMTCTNASTNSGNPLTRMFIDSNGNVGINRSSPGYALDVNGSLNVNNQAFITNDTSVGDARLNIRDYAGNCISFYVSTTKVGSITSIGSVTAFNTSSDYRLKENVVPLTNALARVAQIPVHRFNFISEPNKTVDGFIAHEVAEVIPEAVTGEKDKVDDQGNIDPQGIDQSKLVPLLTAAIKELKTELDAIKSHLGLN
jgi:hypothetical protein